MTVEAYDITDVTTTAAVVGSDPWAAALVALDIARSVAPNRRVTILDLTGGAPPLILETTSSDPHGVSDCFVYGISFGAVTHPTSDPNIFVIPSGTEPLDYAAMLPSRRWDRLVRTAHDSGTLVIFVVPPEAAELGELLARVDRVVAAEVPSRTPVTALHMAPARRTPRPRGTGSIDRAIAAVLLVGLIAGALTYAIKIEKRPAPPLTAATDTAPRASDTVISTATAQLDPAPSALPSRHEGMTAGKTEVKPQAHVRQPAAHHAPAPAAVPAPATPAPAAPAPAAPAPAIAPPPTAAARAPAPAAPAAGARGANGYAVQFAASYDRGVAEALVRRLESSGVQARMVASSGDHPLYRVVQGPYATRALADSAGRLTHEPYWVRAGMP